MAAAITDITPGTILCIAAGDDAAAPAAPPCRLTVTAQPAMSVRPGWAWVRGITSSGGKRRTALLNVSAAVVLPGSGQQHDGQLRPGIH